MSAAQIQQLLRCVEGSTTGEDRLVRSDDAFFTFAAEPYNVRLTSSLDPVGIFYPSSTDSISKAINCARKIASSSTSRPAIPVVARSGGHSYAAYSLGGSMEVTGNGTASSSSTSFPAERSLVIDTHAHFRSISYDDRTEVVTVGAGALLGDLNEMLERNGRAIPSGSCPTVGVGGQALAGGFGLPSRSWGLLLDNMLSVDLVTADGTSLKASAEENQELFWGMRGAGSSLAIATSFTFKTYPVPPKVTYFELTLRPRVLLPSSDAIARASNLFAVFQAFGKTDEAAKGLGFSWHVTPEGPGLKVEILGQYTHANAGDRFEVTREALETAVKQSGEEDFEFGSRELTYLQSMHNVGGDWSRLPERGDWNNNEHVHFYAKSLITKQDVSPTSMQRHMTRLFELSKQRHDNLEWFVLSPYLGGVNSAVVNSKTSAAFAHRDLQIVWELYAKGKVGAPEVDVVEWVKGMMTGLEQVEAVYPAYVDAELTREEYPRLTYGELYPKLQALKARFDGRDLFRYPQSIKADVGITNQASSLSELKWVSVPVVLFFVGLCAWYGVVSVRKRARQESRSRKLA